MDTYFASSAAASNNLTPFTEPPPTTNEAAPADASGRREFGGQHLGRQCAGTAAAARLSTAYSGLLRAGEPRLPTTTAPSLAF